MRKPGGPPTYDRRVRRIGCYIEFGLCCLDFCNSDQLLQIQVRQLIQSRKVDVQNGMWQCLKSGCEGEELFGGLSMALTVTFFWVELYY